MGGHHHDVDGVELVLPGATGRVLRSIAGLLALVTLAAMVALWPSGDDRPDLEAYGFVSDFYEAEVTSLEAMDCPGQSVDPLTSSECARVDFTLREGPHPGSVVSQELYNVAQGLRFDLGERVVLSYSPEAGPGFEYQFADRARLPVLGGLAVLFAVVVVALGRWRGLTALAGLAASLGVLLVFVLPAIIEGSSPVLVAVVGAAAIAFLALYLTHGFGDMTTVALLGTLGSLALTAALATLFVGLTRLSGFTEDSSFYLTAANDGIDLRGLILAGMIIGGLGAIDDMTVTQASAVWQLHLADPSLSVRGLVSRGLTIGRDHVASTVNTLVLAYAGAAMPLMLLFVLANQSLGTVANSEVVATEIVRTLVGSIGLVAAVPLTTWLAAITARATASETDAPPPTPT